MKPALLKSFGILLLCAMIVSGISCKTSSTTDGYTLTVTVAAGASGVPAAGQTTYQKGDTVTYSYALQSGYQNLVVILDGVTVAASGSFTMNGNHVLAVSASASGSSNHTLTITLGAGASGTPAVTASYAPGTAVPYNYTLQSGYQNLVVTLDGSIAVPPSGTLTMNADHAMAITATPATNSYALGVTLGAGVTGTPAASTSYAPGTAVPWNYSLQSGFTNLVVKLDGITTTASGSVTMNANHTLTTTATPPSNSHTLTVNCGAGVSGTPFSSASYTIGSTVAYSYTLQSGYTNLVVKLDGVTAAASGNVVMNTDHTLTVTATAPVRYTITVSAFGYEPLTYWTGFPLTTTLINAGYTLNYTYTLSGLAPAGSLFSVQINGVMKTPPAGVTSFSGSIVVNSNIHILLTRWD